MKTTVTQVVLTIVVAWFAYQCGAFYERQSILVFSRGEAFLPDGHHFAKLELRSRWRGMEVRAIEGSKFTNGVVHYYDGFLARVTNAAQARREWNVIQWQTNGVSFGNSQTNVFVRIPDKYP